MYGGVHAAYGGGSQDSAANSVRSGEFFWEPPESPSIYRARRQGFLGGLEVGYNRSLDPVILGVEADWAMGRINGTATLTGIDPLNMPRKFTSFQTATVNWLSTWRLRLGVPIGPTLVYGTGGLALGVVKYAGGLAFPTYAYSGSHQEMRTGWALGGGVEVAASGPWRARAEVLAYDLGDGTSLAYRKAPTSFHFQSDFAGRGTLFRLGATYSPGAEDGPEIPSILAGVTGELGIRYWHSAARSHYSLYDTTGNVPISRLTYSGHGGHAAEFFGRLDHPSGIFLRGILGTDVGPGGHLKDEDFPFFIQPYSATVSDQRHGGMLYGTADLGADLYENGGSRFGLFLGYHLQRERMNAYGCQQIAHFQAICPSVNPGALAITEEGIWHAARLGVTGTADLGLGFALSADLAWIPFGVLQASDSHWLRIGAGPGSGFTGPIPQNGTAQGSQIELLMTYKVTDSLQLGLGGRLWHLRAEGTMDFTGLINGGEPQVARFTTQRSGFFVQAGFRL